MINKEGFHFFKYNDELLFVDDSRPFDVRIYDEDNTKILSFDVGGNIIDDDIIVGKLYGQLFSWFFIDHNTAMHYLTSLDRLTAIMEATKFYLDYKDYDED